MNGARRTDRVLDLGALGTVSARSLEPQDPRAHLVLGHGAGAGMTHPFLESIAVRLASRAVATFRYQFPYMERGQRRTDPPSVATATTSTAASLAPLPEVQGLVFLGFPLHPAGRPGTERAVHLDHVQVPMLFLEGTRDTLCDLELLGHVLRRLGRRATLHLWDGADHSFHVVKRSGKTDEQVLDELADAIAAWCGTCVASDR
ncbi:MAG: alpha/beta hydrolase [Candidatus Eisenbacteria bacterium]|uniref:Alpha/beta hydrolase n=1 Tax=Eiseniibacteriota bacterium TaxID=2212470 RepID=A0A538U1B7_UNCEI|nr:MAG: alpha/beta hydrolase [Candidatus Eisenbacteria bacterium]